MYFYIVLVTLFLFWIYERTKKPAGFPPGPPRLPIVGGLPFFMKNASLLHSMRYMVEKYGPISSVYVANIPFIFVADYTVLKELFKREEVSTRPPIRPNNENRPGWNLLEKENEGRMPGVIGTGGKYWQEQRRFLLKNLKDFGFGRTSMESLIQDEMVKLCSKLAKIKEDEPVDLNRSMNISILNALWFILVGEKLDLENPQSSKCISMIDNLIRTSSGPFSIWVLILPHTSLAKLPGLRQLTGVDVNHKTFKEIRNFIQPYIQQHIDTLDPENIRDFMDLMLLEIKNTTDKNSSFYGDSGYFALFNSMIDLFLAGMETTSSSLTWTFLFLLHHPDVQTKIHRELDEVVGRNRYPSLEDRPKLHYLNAVLLESLRTASLLGPGVPHYSTVEVKVGDYIIPKGSTIFGSLYHVMNDPNHFKDPHTFKPERFINEEGKFVSDDRVIPFGIGKRICLGQTLADKELYIFFSGFMQCFEIIKPADLPLPSYNIDHTFPKGPLRRAPSYRVQLKQRFSK